MLQMVPQLRLSAEIHSIEAHNKIMIFCDLSSQIMVLRSQDILGTGFDRDSLNFPGTIREIRNQK